MSRNRFPQLAVVVATALIAFPAVAAEGISREQGDVIISELRQIRMLLEKQQKPAEAPAPKEERVRLRLGKEFSLGSPDAPVTMVEYTDYQCPFCSSFYTKTFPDLKREFIDTGKLRFISRDFPLDFHQHAMKAAVAARCAGEQGKFWEMKQLLMTNSSRLSPEMISLLAKNAGLRTAEFEACTGGDTVPQEIREGMSAAQGIGIGGTPSFVVGTVADGVLEGVKVVGALPLSEFRRVVREAEEKRGKQDR